LISAHPVFVLIAEKIPDRNGPEIRFEEILQDVDSIMKQKAAGGLLQIEATWPEGAHGAEIAL
jgi:hypothetical protein